MLLSPPGSEIKQGPAPQAFIMAILFTLGFVFFLAVSSVA
jgi:hypothetical protein